MLVQVSKDDAFILFLGWCMLNTVWSYVVYYYGYAEGRLLEKS